MNKVNQKTIKYLSFGLIIVGSLVSIGLVLFTELNIIYSLLIGVGLCSLGIGLYLLKFKKINKEERDELKELNHKLFLFLNTLSLYLSMGNNFTKSWDLATGEYDEGFNESMNMYINDKTGPINATKYVDKLNYIFDNNKKLDNLSLIKNIQECENFVFNKKNYGILLLGVIPLLIMCIFLIYILM